MLRSHLEAALVEEVGEPAARERYRDAGCLHEKVDHDRGRTGPGVAGGAGGADAGVYLVVSGSQQPAFGGVFVRG